MCPLSSFFFSSSPSSFCRVRVPTYRHNEDISISLTRPYGQLSYTRGRFIHWCVDIIVLSRNRFVGRTVSNYHSNSCELRVRKFTFGTRTSGGPERLGHGHPPSRVTTSSGLYTVFFFFLLSFFVKRVKNKEQGEFAFNNIITVME